MSFFKIISLSIVAIVFCVISTKVNAFGQWEAWQNAGLSGPELRAPAAGKGKRFRFWQLQTGQPDEPEINSPVQ